MSSNCNSNIKTLPLGGTIKEKTVKDCPTYRYLLSDVSLIVLPAVPSGIIGKGLLKMRI